MAYQAEIEKLEARFREKPEQWFAALADAYRKAGDLDMALEVLGAWIDKRPNYTSGNIVLGRCYLDKAEDLQAAKAFESVLELDMENVIALKCLSEIAERQGDTAAARNWLERLLEVDPMNEEAQAALDAMGEGAPVETGAEGAEQILEEPADVPGFEPTAEEVDEEAAARESVEVEGRVEAVDVGDAGAEGDEEPVEEMVVEEEHLDVVGMMPGADEEFPSEPVAEPLSDIATEEVEDAAAALGGLGAEWEAEPAQESVVQEEHLDVVGMMPGADEEFPVSVEATLPEPIEAMHAPVEAEPEPEPEPEEPEVAVPEALVAEAEEGRAIPPTIPEFPPIRIEAEEEAPEELAAELEVEKEAEEAAPSEPDTEARPSIGLPEMSVYDGGSDAAALPSVGRAEERDAVLEAAVEIDAGAAGVEFVEPPPEDLDASVAEQPTAEPEPEAEKPLELIVPEAASEQPEQPEEDSAEPEPIVTETMAELYAKQGLIEEAKDIYRLLLVSRPGNAHLRTRLAELEEAEAGVASEPTPADSFLASATGGESVKSLMDALLGAAVTTEAAEMAETAETAEETETLGRIEKTKETPAVDTEQAAPAAPAAPSAPSDPSAPAEEGRSFSFDDFFGAGKPEESQEPPPPEASGTQGPENEEFKDWLKGLKT